MQPSAHSCAAMALQLNFNYLTGSSYVLSCIVPCLQFMLDCMSTPLAVHVSAFVSKQCRARSSTKSLQVKMLESCVLQRPLCSHALRVPCCDRCR